MMSPDFDFEEIVFALHYGFDDFGNITNGGKSYVIKPGGDLFVKKGFDPSDSIDPLLQNRLGPKQIYVRIMRPDQLLMVKSDNDVFQFEDLKIQYSAMREVVYEGQDLPVAIFWDNTNEPEMMPGTYTVNLFADGNEIGETTFEIQ